VDVRNLLKGAIVGISNVVVIVVLLLLSVLVIEGLVYLVIKLFNLL
jgi:hypothetical protein